MDCSLPGFSANGIFQARVLEWGAIYYSAINKNEIMPSAATWMDLEIITLSEISQTEKDKHHIISLICSL